MKMLSIRSLSMAVIAAALILSASTSWAQKAKMHQIVFELTSDNEDQWQALLCASPSHLKKPSNALRTT